MHSYCEPSGPAGHGDSCGSWNDTRTAQHNYDVGAAWQTIRREVFVKRDETLKLLVPAGLYTAQNNFLYLAISNLPAAVYQVVYQVALPRAPS